MTDDELDRLDALARAATPGPWDNTHHYTMAGVFTKPNDVGVPVGQCYACSDTDPNAEPVRLRKTYHVHRKPHQLWHEDGWHEINNTQGVTVAGMYGYEEGGIINQADSDFIAASRTALPALVAEVRRLRRQLAGLQAFVDDAVGQP